MASTQTDDPVRGIDVQTNARNKHFFIMKTPPLKIQVLALFIINTHFDLQLLKKEPHLKQVFDGQEAFLLFSQVCLDDSGEYECLAELGSTEVSTFCKLLVKGRFT